MAKKLWFTLRGGVTGKLRAYVVDKLGDSFGEYWPAKGVILVKQDDPCSMKRTALHELLHACISTSSGHIREACFGSSSYTREERVVGFIEPGLFDLLDQGMLRLPEPPKLKTKSKAKSRKK